MHWIVPTEENLTNGKLKTRPWEAADQLGANSALTSTQYTRPVLKHIILRQSEIWLASQCTKLEKCAFKTKG